jgi:hypothetical protein
VDDVGDSTPTPVEPGWLRVVVAPWAEVFVDNEPKGLTPLRRLALAPGLHTVELRHPAFEPYRRELTLRPGEERVLKVDLETEGVRR